MITLSNSHLYNVAILLYSSDIALCTKNKHKIVSEHTPSPLHLLQNRVILFRHEEVWLHSYLYKSCTYLSAWNWWFESYICQILPAQLSPHLLMACHSTKGYNDIDKHYKNGASREYHATRAQFTRHFNFTVPYSIVCYFHLYGQVDQLKLFEWCSVCINSTKFSTPPFPP